MGSKMTNREKTRQRLYDLNQPVPRESHTTGWLYEGDEGLLTPIQHLGRCEDLADDEEALDHLSRSSIHLIKENGEDLY